MLNLFNSLTKVNPENKILSREIEQKFKEKRLGQLENLVSCDVDNPELIQQLFGINIPRDLENFLDCVTSSLDFEGKQELQQKLEELKANHVKTDNEKQNIQQNIKKFVAMQSLIKEILANANNKQILLQSAWDEYGSQPEQQTCNVLDHKPLSSCGDQYYQQMQADPPKRAGYILYQALFDFLDKSLYIESNGKCRLSVQDYESGPNDDENALQRLWRIQTGNAFTPPPGG